MIQLYDSAAQDVSDLLRLLVPFFANRLGDPTAPTQLTQELSRWVPQGDKRTSAEISARLTEIIAAIDEQRAGRAVE